MSKLRSLLLLILCLPLLAVAQQLPTPPSLAARSWLLVDVASGQTPVSYTHLSGLDGIFLPGFPVARVVHVERDTSYSFARIFCMPLAGVENFSEVMILDPRPAVALPEHLAREAAGRDVKSTARSGLAKKKRLKKD